MFDARKIGSEMAKAGVKEAGRQLLEETPAVLRIPARTLARLKKAKPHKSSFGRRRSRPLTQESIDRKRG